MMFKFTSSPLNTQQLSIQYDLTWKKSILDSLAEESKLHSLIAQLHWKSVFYCVLQCNLLTMCYLNTQEIEVESEKETENSEKEKKFVVALLCDG